MQVSLSSSIRILIGLSLGLILGVAYSSLEGDSMAFLPEVISPIGALWVNAIRMVVIPLLMALLITSIAGGGSGVIVAQLGGKTIGLFVLFFLCSSMFAFVSVPPLLVFLSIDPAASTALLESTG